MKEEISRLKEEARSHLVNELMPFWLDRCRDDRHGGFISHFDKNGLDSGEDEKSLIAQTRLVYAFSLLHRNGYGAGECAELARHGVDFLLDKFWDSTFGGFFWTSDRAGNVKISDKILYGQSFAIYGLSEFTRATGDPRGLHYARETLSAVYVHAADIAEGGFHEMFARDWKLKGPGSAGGDRKTLDVHMHLMEAFTALCECSPTEGNRRRLRQIVDLCCTRLLDRRHYTGIAQFYENWKIAPQIKFDIVWGWDRFNETGVKQNAEDTTSYGHNVEFAWLLLHALDVLDEAGNEPYQIARSQIDHAVAHGIDPQYGGVYVDGSHDSEVYDTEKEFWQNAEMLVALSRASLLFGPEKYWTAYKNVHRFVFDKLINHQVGEWWPLLTREGTPIWTHMSHSWKVGYHTIRSMVLTIQALEGLISGTD